MGRAENDIDGVRAGFDDSRHGIDHGLDAFARRQQAERENDGLSAEPELGLGVMGLEKWKVGDAVRDHLDLLWWHVMHGPEELAAFFCHDDDLCRRGNDLAHDVALSRRRCREHRMKRRDDRHGEALQELDDVSTGLTAENPVLMLQGNNVEPRSVQEIGGLRIAIDRLLLDLETHGRRIVIGAAGIVHGNDAGLQIRARCRDRPMQIMREGGNSAAARKMIADERNTLEWFHCIVPTRPFAGAALVRGTAGWYSGRVCIRLGRAACCSRSGTGPPAPAYATRPTMPMGPACISTRSDCAKTASPAATSNDPARALPLTTSSQVSRSASRLPGGAWRPGRSVRTRSAGWRPEASVRP